MIILILIVILIFSAIVHEYAHGWMARRLGDDTAERAGRLTLNPIPHIDPIGSIVLPLILTLTHAGFFIAWAKPLPYNPNNLTDRKFGELKVAIAGPITNFIIAIIFGLVARFLPLTEQLKIQLVNGFITGDSAVLSLVSGSFLASLAFLAMAVCIVNLMLGIFNLVPIPPLDGSKVLAGILPYRGREAFYRLEKYGLIILILLLLTNFFNFIFYWVIGIFGLLTGL